ncbi:MAG TPA: hypothetical protein VGF34_00880 [Stellaceae bacterium]|jgi:hypothetical protein
MTELVALRAMFGQDEANHGTHRYCVDPDGLVHVPPEAVPYLTRVGGFAAVTADAAPRPEAEVAERVRLHHEEALACSYGGRQYPSDANGDVLVPAQAVADLAAHGYVPVIPEVEAAPPPRRAAKGKAVKE